MDLVFRDIEVSINNELILKRLSGIAEKGEMLAIMGPSGKLTSLKKVITVLNGNNRCMAAFTQ